MCAIRVRINIVAANSYSPLFVLSAQTGDIILWISQVSPQELVLVDHPSDSKT